MVKYILMVCVTMVVAGPSSAQAPLPPLAQACFQSFTEQAAHAIDRQAKIIEEQAQISALKDELAKARSGSNVGGGNPK